MKFIEFSAPWEARFADGPGVPESAGTVIQNEASVVSPGTELAILSGGESWAPLPYVPGYGSVGRVVRAGPECARRNIKEGDRVFTYGKHAEQVAADTVCVPVPAGTDPARGAFARIAAVSVTALRCSEIELGDRVAVFGAGLVGIFAAQLARLAGASVWIIDPSEKRREIARACGVAEVGIPGPGLYDELKAATGGKLFSTVIEATGSPQVAVDAIRFVGKRGEFILLGSPRGSFVTDITPFLNRSHLCPDVVNVKGAHEWRYPVLDETGSFSKHSLERNAEILLEAIAAGTLKVDPLITQRAAPEDAGKMYAGLRGDKDAYLGVVFDWSASGAERNSK